MGLALASPRDPDQRGGSIMVRLPNERPAADILARFRAAEIYADARGQILRLSPGFMTSEAGVARMLRALKDGLE